MNDSKRVALGKKLFAQLQERYPELVFVNITESAEDPDHLWINIVMPEDEEREIAVRELASELSTDLLLTHGFHITVSASTQAGSFSDDSDIRSHASSTQPS